jgi:hypothetical protein
MMHVLAVLALALSIQAEEVGYIVGLYSAKERVGGGRTLLLKLDGKPIAKLRHPTYHRVAVRPGVYEVAIGDSGTRILCHVIAGEFCYVRATTTEKDRKVEVELISPEQAWRELPKTMPVESGQVFVANSK